MNGPDGREPPVGIDGRYQDERPWSGAREAEEAALEML